jgi:hypothetical protein
MPTAPSPQPPCVQHFGKSRAQHFTFFSPVWQNHTRRENQASENFSSPSSANRVILLSAVCTQHSIVRYLIMNKPSSPTDITIAPGVRQTASEDGAVLLDTEQGICFSLNPIGLTIWEMMKQHPSLELVVSALEQQFQVPRAQLEADVLEFVTELENKRLIFRGSQPHKKRGWVTRMFRTNADAAR